MSTPHPDGNLLLGVLALQNGFVTLDALVASLHAWAADRGRPLGDILAGRGALAAEHRRLLDEMVRAQTPTPAADLATPTDPDLTPAYVPPARRFAEIRPHADGGIGRVFLAHDAELNREVALKRIKERFADHGESRARFVREAEITGGLEHPGVVPVYGLGRDPDGRPYYAMRFVRGESLREAVRRFHAHPDSPADAGERALEFRGLLGRFGDVCDAVAYAHSRGVLHRDLKPANVMLGPFGETLVVDWGLAKLLDEPPAPGADAPPPVRPLAGGRELPTEFGRRLGTPAYMAPEQAAGRVDLHDVRTDVYGLGAILFEILTGRAPHSGEDTDAILTKILTADTPRARDVNPHAPRALAAVAARAMSKSPAERHASAAEVAGDVRRWLADEPVAAYRYAAGELARLVERNPGSAGYREQLARTRVSLGMVLNGLGRHAEAEQAFRSALGDYEALAADHPWVARYRADRASALLDLANALERQGRAADAAEARREAVAAYDRLMATNPQDYHTNLASVMATMAPVPPPAPPGPARSESLAPLQTLPAAAAGPPPAEQLREERGRFTMLRQVALGGMSVIWVARDNDLNREVVVKELSGGANPHARGRFLMEAQLTAQLRHPHVIPVYGLGRRSQDDAPFLVLYYAEGGTLLEAVRDCQQGRPGAATVRRLVEVFACACDAVAYAHSRGVLHLDPKPSNILLGRHGEVFVTDWGLAALLPAAGGPGGVVLSEWARPPQVSPGQVIGTPAYMAPEQAAGGPPDARTDVHLLGSTLYHVLTGRPPYYAPSVTETLARVRDADVPRARTVNPAAPPALDAVCARALARQPADRYPTVAELALDVRNWLAGKPVSVYRESFVRRWFRARGG
jgi:serine/threonine protein kinase